MRGSTFITALPEVKGTAAPTQLAQREQMILDAVRRRDIAPIKWAPVFTKFTNSQGHTYTAKLLVSQDALRIGDGIDSVRVSTRHDTAQRIADDLGVALPTAKVSDEIWNQAVIRLPPKERNWWQDGSMSYSSRMLEQHNAVERMVAEEQTKLGGKQGLIADVGKDWVTTLRLWQPYTGSGEQGAVRAANYGWHKKKGLSRSATLPGVDVMQSIGLAHTIGHTDYSQLVRLVRREVEVCGPGMGSTGCAMLDIDQIITDPALAGLLSHEGPLEAMHHPSVQRSCDPGSRCISNFVSGMNVKSLCFSNCDKKTLAPAPDPTIGLPKSGTGSVAAASTGSYAPLVIGAALGLAGTWWYFSQATDKRKGRRSARRPTAVAW